VADSGENILILGIGNVLWADEGFGVRCVETLQANWQMPANVTVLDGGTQGLYLLPFVTEAKRLLVFDAIDYGLEPGTVRVVEGDDVPRFMGAKKMSLHQTGFQEVLMSALLVDALPESLVLIGVQPSELEDFGGSLRPEVRARMPEVLSLALAKLREWGVDPQPLADARTDDSPLELAAYEAGRPDAQSACRIGDERFMPKAAPAGEC
jgi:hydrogenase maturation protease